MLAVESKKSLVEVREVLKIFNKNEKEKIPDNILDLINYETKNINYDANIDVSKNLEDQISREALAILTYICLKYIADEKQKEVGKQILIRNQKKVVVKYKYDVFEKGIKENKKDEP